MNIHYEEMNIKIKNINDIDKLSSLRYYNDKLSSLLTDLVVTANGKNIFESCVEYLKYLSLLDNVIEKQMTKVLDDMVNSQPADEED